MPRSRAQLEQAAAEEEAWLDELDPTELSKPEADATDLRRVGVALDTVAAAENELAEAVRLARENGRSWADIAWFSGCPGKQPAPHQSNAGTPGSPETQLGIRRHTQHCPEPRPPIPVLRPADGALLQSQACVAGLRRVAGLLLFRPVGPQRRGCCSKAARRACGSRPTPAQLR